MEKTNSWQYWAECLEEDTQVDYSERFFICPHCGEPIYESDYPMIVNNECPICWEEY